MKKCLEWFMFSNGNLRGQYENKIVKIYAYGIRHANHCYGYVLCLNFKLLLRVRDRQTDTDKQTDRQTDQSLTETGRQTDRQTDR